MSYWLTSDRVSAAIRNWLSGIYVVIPDGVMNEYSYDIINEDYDDGNDEDDEDNEEDDDYNVDDDGNHIDYVDLFPPAPQQPTYSWIMVMTLEARSSWSHR